MHKLNLLHTYILNPPLCIHQHPGTSPLSLQFRVFLGSKMTLLGVSLLHPCEEYLDAGSHPIPTSTCVYQHLKFAVAFSVLPVSRIPPPSFKAIQATAPNTFLQVRHRSPPPCAASLPYPTLCTWFRSQANHHCKHEIKQSPASIVTSDQWTHPQPYCSPASRSRPSSWGSPPPRFACETM